MEYRGRQLPAIHAYGRFARGFDVASGKNAMCFDIVNRFFGGKPLNGAYPVEVRVVYFDSGCGAWGLEYDAVSNPRKTALEVHNTNTGRWKEVRVTLADAFFGDRCSIKTDLVLANTSKENTLFHMVEVIRSPR